MHGTGWVRRVRPCLLFPSFGSIILMCFLLRSVCLENSLIQEICIPQSTIRISTKAANSGSIYAAAAKYGGITGGESYNDRGELEVTITCDEENGDRLKDDIVDATRGGVIFLE